MLGLPAVVGAALAPKVVPQILLTWSVMRRARMTACWICGREREPPVEVEA